MNPIDLTNAVILDTETTGLNDAEACEISIIDGAGNVLFDTLIKPTKPIEESAIRIHGITNEMVANTLSFMHIVDEIMPILLDKQVIIYNANFDIRVLLNCAKSSKILTKQLLNLKTTCAMLWYAKYRQVEGYYPKQYKWHKLVDACKHEQINIADFTAHRALGDCQMTLALVNAVNTKLNPPKEEQKIMETSQIQPTELVADIWVKVNYELPVISFDKVDFDAQIDTVLAPVVNLGSDLDEKTLKSTLANLRKFSKAANDRRIAIVKQINEPISKFELEVKTGIFKIDKLIQHYDEQLQVIATKEKAAKGTKIDKMILDAIEKHGLTEKYAVQLTLSDEYYLQKWTLIKLEDEINSRAAALFKQQDYDRVQAELHNSKIENRTRLIEQLNAEYNLEFKYATLPIDRYDDLAVRQHYINTRASLDKKQQEAIGQNVVAPKAESQQIVAPAEPKTETQNKPGIIYQNLRLGAESQMAIMTAVAKLKQAGLSVEFIK